MQISLFDINLTNDFDYDEWEYGFELEYRDGFQLEYDESSDKVTVLYYDWGLKVKEIEMAVGKLRGSENNFIDTRDISFNMRNTNSGSVLGLLGLTLPSRFMSSVWTAATSNYVDSYTQGSTKLLGDSIDEQMEKYSGKVTRGVFFDSGSAYMYSEGEFANLIATCTVDPSVTSYLNYAYKYVCYHSL